MYEYDSFYTLTAIQQAGLGVLSLLLFGVLVYFCFRAVRQKPLAIRIIIASVVFYIFVWLSPQIYYTYYLLIFDGLPIQIVIKAPPTPLSLTQLLMFQEKASLSDHSKAGLGWVLIAIALLRQKT
jgi:hypothetical protein